MKFDCVVGNPPYGEDKVGSSRFLHLKIMRNSIKLCNDRMSLIMPSKPIVKQLEDEWYKVFREAVCTRIDIMDKSVFPGTKMDNTAVFYFERKAVDYCKKLDVDKIIYNMIDNEGHRLFFDKMGCFGNIGFWSYRLNNQITVEKQVKMIVDRMGDCKYYLNVNRFSGGSSIWFSNKLYKVPVFDKEGEIDYCKNNTEGKNIIECPNRQYAENLKKLMHNGLVLHYGLFWTKYSRSIVSDNFKYVPDIDYTYIHTDEELLSACGFNKEETEKTMKYLRNFDFSKNRNDLIRNYNF